MRNDDSELEVIFFLSLATITSTERKLESTFSFFPIYSLEISLLIFLIRNKIEQAHGKTGVKQKSFYGFESEDILYIVPLLALTDTLIYFLYLSSIGSPIGLIITYLIYKKL